MQAALTCGSAPCSCDVLAALPAARDDVRTLENTGSPTLISIVIPLFNEVGNVPLIIETLKVALDGMN